ncbi:MAG: sensor histidine kinase [Chloroflexota bacterium]
MRSLGVKLALWYGVGVAALLLLLGAFLYAALDRYLTIEAYTLLRAQAVPLQRLAEQEVHTPAELTIVARQLVQRPAASGIGVYVLAPGGRVVAGSRAALEQLPQGPAALRTLPAGSAKTEVVKQAGVRYLLLYQPLNAAGRNIGALLLTTSLEGVDRTLRSFVGILGIGIGATLLIMSLVVIGLTHLGLKPLRLVVQKAGQIAEGDLAQRVDASSAPSEIRRLGEAFNHMAGRLQESFQAQRAFVADASHELRTPLTSLAGYIDILRKGGKDEPATLERVLGTMRAEVQRLTRLVSDLVALARLDAGDQLQIRPVDLTRLVEDVYEQAKAMAPSREINLRANDGLWVQADLDRLRQVLLNLADNALKYTPPAAYVNFAIQAVDACAQVSVADNGPGIPPEDRDHLFDRFYRAERSRTREKGGAGLGLAIAKKIVEAHHGSISVSSPPDGGTIFAIRLPLTPPPVAP